MFLPDASRSAGLDRMHAFAPRMGGLYAEHRNIDHGPGAHHSVSTLSPYLRRRLLLEREVVACALAHHGAAGAEKFVQEVIWRGYFKGWLEHRPQVWYEYRDGLVQDLQQAQQDAALRRRLEQAEQGHTGIECFDVWAGELRQTGYLHNHARMWFASIWIFTLQLPWRLGADFFYRYLLDGDPASNTLSWRWVAGLHTRGKPYQADADNIARWSHGRFTPGANELAQNIEGLDAQEPEGLPERQPLREVMSPRVNVPTALLITEEDCCVEDFPRQALDIVASATLTASHLRSPSAVSEQVANVERQALADAAQRAGVDAHGLMATHPDDLVSWARAVGAQQIVTPYVPNGPLRDWLDQAQAELTHAGIRLAEWQRDWDRVIWPHATAGFFKLKKRLPDILEQTRLT